ncbi:MAG: molybdopterin adenylyltransferase [Deltaproteobacteria bacterium]|nr:molybdopterin adenylyltransferase [Deltaproteobacteria bacterium]
MSYDKKLIIGILTVSDRASSKEYEDKGGPAVRAELKSAITSPWDEVYAVIPDERPIIEKTLIDMADEKGCSLIITTGGTGVAPRDVTPDATEAVCDRILPGFGEAMRAESLKKVPTAILSRQTAGVRKSCLIINLPGKPSAIAECLGAVFPAIADCLDLIGAPELITDPSKVKSHRAHKH